MAYSSFSRVCSCEEDASEASLSEVELFGNTYPAGYYGPVNIDHAIEEDNVTFRIPAAGAQRGYNISMGGASVIRIILVRIRPESTTIQALCDDGLLTAADKCSHCGACSCCGPVGCCYEE